MADITLSIANPLELQNVQHDAILQEKSMKGIIYSQWGIMLYMYFLFSKTMRIFFIAENNLTVWSLLLLP